MRVEIKARVLKISALITILVALRLIPVHPPIGAVYHTAQAAYSRMFFEVPSLIEKHPDLS